MREEKAKQKWRDQLQRASEENQSNLGRLVPAGEVVAFLSVGADKDKEVVSSYKWVLVKKGVGAS